MGTGWTGQDGAIAICRNYWPSASARTRALAQFFSGCPQFDSVHIFFLHSFAFSRHSTFACEQVELRGSAAKVLHRTSFLCSKRFFVAANARLSLELKMRGT